MKTGKLFRIGMAEDPIKWRTNVRFVAKLCFLAWCLIFGAIGAIWWWAS